MIKGRPAEVVKVTAAKSGGKRGKGKGKVLLQALDLSSGAKHEETKSKSHLVKCPFTNYECYRVLEPDPETGAVELFSESGQPRADLRFPGHGAQYPRGKGVALAAEILEAQASGEAVDVSVLSACGDRKIVAMRIDEEDPGHEKQEVIAEPIATCDGKFLGNFCPTVEKLLDRGLSDGGDMTGLVEHLQRVTAGPEA